MLKHCYVMLIWVIIVMFKISNAMLNWVFILMFKHSNAMSVKLLQ
jgi:hypothetical protein